MKIPILPTLLLCLVFAGESCLAAGTTAECAREVLKLLAGHQPDAAFLPMDKTLEDAYVKAGQEAWAKLQAHEATLAAPLKPLKPEDRRVFFEQAFADSYGRGGGLAIFDTPKAIPGVPKELYQRINIDHHAFWFDPNRPMQDTTKQLLKVVEDGIEGKGAASPEEIAALKRRFRFVSTDNLGDGGWSVWISENLERVAKDPALRRRIRIATHWEDFGSFGTQFERAGLKQEGKDAIALQKAIFKNYDDLLGKYGIRGSDRFNTLPAEKQAALMKEATDYITRAVDHPEVVKADSAAFDAARASAQKTIETSHQALTAEIERTNPAIAKVLREQTYIYEAGPSLSQNGTFATWTASALGHDRPIGINFMSLPNGKQGFIIAVPNGRHAPISFGRIAERIRQANLTAAGKAGADLAAAGAAVGSRGGDLAFSFMGVDVPRDEILKIVAEELTAAHL